MGKYNIHFLGNCTIEAGSEDEAFDKFLSTHSKPSEAAEEYDYDVEDVSEIDMGKSGDYGQSEGDAQCTK